MSSEVKFKSVKRKRKQFRKRNEEEEEKEMEENREMEEEEGEEGEGEGGHRTKIQETLEMQKLRQRTAGKDVVQGLYHCVMYTRNSLF